MHSLYASFLRGRKFFLFALLNPSSVRHRPQRLQLKWETRRSSRDCT
jgi:hypothetical protein